MGVFGSNFPDFRAIWLGTTKPKQQNRYGAADKNIQTFMSNLGYLWLTRTPWIAPSELIRTFRAVKLQSVCSYRCERRHFRSDEHVIKGGKERASNFRQLWGGVVSFLFVSRTKTRVLRTREDLCYHCGPFHACVGIVFNHLLVWMSFSRTSEDIYMIWYG
jgi:hypothetical protein